MANYDEYATSLTARSASLGSTLLLLNFRLFCRCSLQAAAVHFVEELLDIRKMNVRFIDQVFDGLTVFGNQMDSALSVAINSFSGPYASWVFLRPVCIFPSAAHNEVSRQGIEAPSLLHS